MANRLLHTPEGVRDIYSGECRRKLALESKILKVLYLYGYEHLETPSFEYFDIFNKDGEAWEIGKCLSFSTEIITPWF